MFGYEINTVRYGLHARLITPTLNLAERYCGVVKARIAKSQIDGTGHWGESLAVLEDILNSEPKADTGFAPYKVLTGFRPRHKLHNWV